MADEDFPITKSDVHYNAETQEVTLPREKYDALISYVRGLVEQVSAADDERDIAEYRARRAKASESVLQEMVADVAEMATKSVSRWLESHSIRQLSERSGIPYATCHRIVNERLGTSRIDVETLGRLARAIKPLEPSRIQTAGELPTTRDRPGLRSDETLPEGRDSAKEQKSVVEAGPARPDTPESIGAPALTRWEPWREFSALQNRMNHLFRESFERGWGGATASSFVPVDAYEDEHAVTLKIEVPGMDEKDIDIRLENNTLTVHGERKIEGEENEANFYSRVERQYGSFSRTFFLPANVDSEAITANYDKGVLKITIPKLAAGRGRKNVAPGATIRYRYSENKEAAGG